MMQWIAKLCGLEGAGSEASAPLLLEWQAAMPRWLVFVLGCLLALWIVRTYRAEVRRARRRIVPALLRAGALAGLLVVICKPQVVLERDRVERAEVAVVIDASTSMQQTDGGAPTAARRTRFQQALAALTDARANALRALVAANDVGVYLLADDLTRLSRCASAEDIDRASAVLSAQAANGKSTRLAQSLLQLLADRRTSPLAAVVLFSDGQDQSRPQADALVAAARSHRVPIHVVPLGSPAAPRDLQVAALELSGGVYSGDLLTVRATVRAAGLTEPMAAEVRLVDEVGGATLATQTLELSGENPTALVELLALPGQTGTLPLRVAVTPLPDEIDTDNNIARGAVDVLAEHLRVLYVEGYPRYEYRYLKNALIREPTVRVSCLLLSADEDFAQEGTEPVRRFPQSAEELADFDVVILGDVDPRGYWISPAQLELLADFVVRRGGGLAFIAGELHNPHDFRGTPLADLLPVRIDPAFTGTYASRLEAGFRPRLTAAGREAPMFRWQAGADENLAAFAALPELYWFARTGGARLGAETLLEHPAARLESGPLPLVVSGRCGAGRTYFQATDDTWRWRRGAGELLFDSYWVRVIRALSPGRAQRRGDRVALVVDPPVARLGERVRVRLIIRDPLLLADAPERLAVVARAADGFVRQGFELAALAENGSEYAGGFTPRDIGEYSIGLADDGPIPAGAGAAARLRVEAADVEARDLRADPAYLARLAESAGGRVFAPDQLVAELSRIEDASRRTPDDVRASLWDTPVALGLVVILLAGEWLLRRLMGMV